MSKMADFFGEKGTTLSKVERAAALSKGKTKAERRRIEQALLKPEPIPEYTGVEPGTLSDVEARRVTFIAPNDRLIDLMKKHFKVNFYKGANIRDVDKLVVFLEALEEGVLRYDSVEKALYFVNEIGEEARVS